MAAHNTVHWTFIRNLLIVRTSFVRKFNFQFSVYSGWSHGCMSSIEIILILFLSQGCCVPVSIGNVSTVRFELREFWKFRTGKRLFGSKYANNISRLPGNSFVSQKKYEITSFHISLASSNKYTFRMEYRIVCSPFVGWYQKCQKLFYDVEFKQPDTCIETSLL